MRKQPVPRRDLRLAALAEYYLTACRTEGKTPKTLRGYREKLLRFVRWLDGSVADLTIESARAFIADLQARDKWQDIPTMQRPGEKLSAQTVVNHVRVIKAFSTWLYEEGYTKENAMARLALPKAPRKVIEVLSEEEIGRLLGAIDPAGATGSRDRAIIILFLDAGLRLSELVSLKVEDVHLEDQWLKVMGKGQKERMVSFGSRAAQALIRYLQLGRHDPLMRPEFFLTASGEPISENTLKMLFARLKRRSGIRRLHPHLLRHTFATHYLIAGGDVFTLQHILGHTTLEMTRRYVTLASSHVSVQHRRFSPMDRLDLPGLKRGGGRRRLGQQPTLAFTSPPEDPIPFSPRVMRGPVR